MERYSKTDAYRNTLALLRALLNPSRNVDALEIPFFGFGGLKELLLPLDNKSQWTKEDLRHEAAVHAIHDELKVHFGPNYDEAVTSLKQSLLSSFYTPSFIIDPLIESLKDRHIHSILDPAAGTGHFVGPLHRAFPDADITAIEKDHSAHAILTLLHPNAENIHSGYENFKTQRFDLVISNIPFGNSSVFDDAIFKERIPVKVKSTTRIHNYYFVKSLDNLKEGGMLAFVTSSAVMDSPGNREVREHLIRYADLVSAIRLPNNSFQQAGTFPVTDIIVLQKNTRKRTITQKEKLFIRSEKINLLNEKGEEVNVDINSYFLDNRDQVIGKLFAGGQYNGRSLDVAPHEGEAADTLSEKIKLALQQPIVTELKSILDKAGDVNDHDKTNLLPFDYPGYDQLRHGNLILIKGMAAIVEVAGNEKIFAQVPIIKDLPHLAEFISLRNIYSRLMEAEQRNDQNTMPTLREELNSHYDLFTFRYGNFNLPSNKKLFLLDSEGFNILSLEKKKENGYGKADIFYQQINNLPVQVGEANTLSEAILISLNAHNEVRIPFIANLLKKTAHAIVEDGLEKQLLYRDVMSVNEKYVTRDVFLSGNIVAKIEMLEENANKLGLRETHFQNHLQQLQEVRPAFLKRELIDINFGERWIPIDIYEDFATKIFLQPTHIKYMESSDMYLVDSRGTSPEESITYGARTDRGVIEGSRIMEYAMADTHPNLRIRLDTEPPTYIPDVEGMRNVQEKITKIKGEFEEYMLASPQVTQRIEDLYNRKVNNSVVREYNGAHLQLDGMQHFSPRGHQKDALWMLLQQNGGIVDHKVGAGKTLVMVAAAMEMRRLKIANKPLLLCMKANVAEIATDFRKAYPNAKLLAPDLKDFTKDKRQQLFASITSNDWDAVILSHDMFNAIPQSAEIKREVITQELRNLEKDLLILADNKAISKRMLKGLENRKNNLSVQLKMTDAAMRRDHKVITFDRMGFDHLFVDESQEFKNLHFTTRHQDVAGLGNPIGSKRALNLEFAIRTIQKRRNDDKGVTFLSGTTISNSLVELYLLFKYLRPAKMEELDIKSFDAWAKMYARKSATYEFSVTNELKMKERFREFIKVPELARLYTEISNVVTDKNLKIDKPEVNTVILNTEPTVEQQKYTGKLVMFAKTKNPSHVDLQLSKEEMNAFMLIATNLARKMSLDMRLIDKEKYSYEHDGKLGKLCETIAHEYRDSHAYKGTQLVFSDIGTPNSKNFNLYGEIKRILVTHYDIPADEIQFIHDFDTRQKRKELFRKLNKGEVRMLIGSTKKLGTGVNVQERVIAMHHLDIPWRPSDFEQRTGRGGRQGNTFARDYRNNSVQNYVYAVNRTLDAYQFNILSNKQKFIHQIKSNSVSQRRMDEGAFDPEGGASFGEYVALLSGNTDLLEKVKLEKKLYDVEKNYQAFVNGQSEAERSIRSNTHSITMQSRTLQNIEKDWELLKDKDLEQMPIKIGYGITNDRKIAGESILEKIKQVRLSKNNHVDTVLASMLSFEMLFNGFNGNVWVKSPNGQAYHYANGIVNENPALAGRYIIDTIKRIPKIMLNIHSDIQERKRKVETYERELKTEFKDKHLIKELRSQINEINVKLEKGSQEKKEETAIQVEITPSLSPAMITDVKVRGGMRA